MTASAAGLKGPEDQVEVQDEREDGVWCVPLLLRCELLSQTSAGRCQRVSVRA